MILKFRMLISLNCSHDCNQIIGLDHNSMLSNNFLFRFVLNQPIERFLEA